MKQELSTLYDRAHKSGFKAGFTAGIVLVTFIFLIILITY
jgi:hypothetical protein